MIWIHSLLVAAALGILYTLRLRSKFYIFIVCSFGLLFFLSVVYTVCDQLTGAGITPSILYHLSAGIGKAGIAHFTPLIISSVILLLCLGVGIYVTARLARHGQNTSLALRYSLVGLLCLAGITHPATHDIAHLLSPAGNNPFNKLIAPSDKVAKNITFDDLYIPPPSDPPAPTKQKNLIFIYLESVEASYLNQSIFPGLLPNIQQLKNDGIFFSDMRPVIGTNSTIAAMVASQCGLPLFSYKGGLSGFLNGAYCIGDLLQSDGYQLSYMGGAHLNFAGKGDFYSTHGFAHTSGFDELLKKTLNPGYRNAWGLYDDTLFDLASAEIDRLNENNGPFALFLLTLDTHYPRGHPSQGCKDVKYEVIDNPILQAVHCSDHLVGQFVRNIQHSPIGEKTTIVLASDHPSMPNTAQHLLESVPERKNMFIILDPDTGDIDQIDKPGSSLDIAPTVLDHLNYNINQWGLGRNLYKNTRTLFEKIDHVSETLWTMRPSIDRFWQYPTIRDNIQLKGPKKPSAHPQMILGEQVIDTPVYMTFNDKFGDNHLAITRMEFKIKSVNFATMLGQQPPDQPFLIIDECNFLSDIRLLSQNGGKNDGRWCFVAGKLNQPQLLSGHINADKTISSATLNKIIKDKANSSPVIYQIRQDLLHRYHTRHRLMYRLGEFIDDRFDHLTDICRSMILPRLPIFEDVWPCNRPVPIGL